MRHKTTNSLLANESAQPIFTFISGPLLRALWAAGWAPFVYTLCQMFNY